VNDSFFDDDGAPDINRINGRRALATFALLAGIGVAIWLVLFGLRVWVDSL
jgi:hypothetical protein